MGEVADRRLRMAEKRRVIGVNASGHPVGEDHHGAVLTDVEVDWMRELYEEGFVGYRALAKWFGVPRDTVVAICKYRRRATLPDKYKTL